MTAAHSRLKRQPLGDLNACSQSDFIAALGDIFENAPWVAEGAAAGRPYPTVAALHDAMMSIVLAASPEAQTDFLRGHPELGGAAARRREIGAHSRNEQAGLSLDRLEQEQAAHLDHLNRLYRERFGFPFIICVRRQTRASLVEQFEARLANPADVERRTALSEIGLITRLRLVERVEGPGAPRTDGRITTHVLDTARGVPAAGITVRLSELEGERLHGVAEGVTNADGRLDQPLVGGGPLRIGRYEIRFELGTYFARSGQPDSFLEMVPIRFRVSEAEAHYHVPLLVSPFGYTTYRGS